MRVRPLVQSVVTVVFLLVVLASGSATFAADADGKAVFEAQKCNMCHSVPAAGITAKTTSEKMLGPEIDGLSGDPAEMGKYLRKQVQIDGKSHKKEFKGEDAELEVLVEWVLQQKK